MLWTGWKLPCASVFPCVSPMSYPMRSCFERMKSDLRLLCLSMRQSESYPMSLHALNRMKSDLRLLMLQRWNSFCVSPCLKQVESWPVTLHVWGWNLTHVSSCFEQAENYPVSFHASVWKLPCAFPCVSLKVTRCLFMLWKDEIWPAPPHASKVELILCLSMP